MKKIFSLLIVSALFLSFFSCGKKGPISPPLIKIPQKVESFDAIQKGMKIVLIWINPTSYIDGNPLEGISEVEIWYAEEEKESDKQGELVIEASLPLEEFLDKAKLLTTVKQEELPESISEEDSGSEEFRYEFPINQEKILIKKYIFGLRILDIKRRESDFSKFLAIEPRILPLPPRNPRSEVFKDRIEILWDPPEKNMDQSSPPIIKGYNIYRGEEKEITQRLNSSLIKETKYDDKDFLFDKKYQYSIRASATDSSPFIESDDSLVLEVEAKDKFAPQAPSGLVSVSGENYISLSWNENREKDFAGYRIWRMKEGEEEYVLLTPEPIKENTFIDTKVEKNKRYDYSITALDELGNESEKSEEISETIKDINHENLPL